MVAVPQQRPAMSEEAAAAIDADAASDKASGSRSQKRVTDSGKASPNGTHIRDIESGEKVMDGTEVAEKVCSLPTFQLLACFWRNAP